MTVICILLPWKHVRKGRKVISDMFCECKKVTKNEKVYFNNGESLVQEGYKKRKGIVQEGYNYK